MEVICETLILKWILTFSQTFRTGINVTSHMCHVHFITWSCRWCRLDAAGGETVNCERVSVHLYTISLSVAVVSDTLYHVTVGVETDKGIVP